MEEAEWGRSKKLGYIFQRGPQTQVSHTEGPGAPAGQGMTLTCGKRAGLLQSQRAMVWLRQLPDTPGSSRGQGRLSE